MTSWINDIIDDVWINVLTNLAPKEFTSIRTTCKHFATISNGENNARINEYWKQRCSDLCDQVVEEYRAASWEAVYKELHLISSETAQEIFPNISTYDDDWSTKRVVYNQLQSHFELSETLIKDAETETHTEKKQELKQGSNINTFDDIDDMNEFEDDEGIWFDHGSIGGCYDLPVPPLLIQCIKLDCANVLAMLLHDRDDTRQLQPGKILKLNENRVNQIINCVTSRWDDVPFVPEAQIEEYSIKYTNVTPLYVACEYNSTKVVKLLLSHDGFIDFTTKGMIDTMGDNKGRTALVRAILQKHSKIAMMMINHINMPIKVLNDPQVFYFACASRLVNVVQLLLNKNVNPNAVMYNSLTLNEMISRLGDAEKDNSYNFCHNNKKDRTIDDITKMINLTVNDKNIKLNQSDTQEKRGTPLTTAIWSLEESKENMNIVDSLIKNGTDVNHCVRTCDHGQSQQNILISPLYVAVYCQKKKFVELLLQNKANVDIGDKSQSLTPLMIACDQSQTKKLMDIVKILLKYEANAFAVSSLGFNVIHTAAVNNHFQSIEAIYNRLVENKVNQNKIKNLFNQPRNSDGKTPYMIAVEMKHTPVLKVLVNVCKVDIINVGSDS